MNRKTISFLFLLIMSTVILSGCFRRKSDVEIVTVTEPVTLTFYGLYDSEDAYAPLIQDYQSQNQHVTIDYKRFSDPEDYLDLIINELAEGEGPDIFMLHNTWLPEHYKKLTPGPESIVTPTVFEELFVEVTHDDLLFPDENGTMQVWGMPLYVDTLALYYNDDHLEEAIPSQGRPSETWEGIKDDVQQLNKEDQSFERFERTGIALGRTDNVSRAFDILMTLFLQHKVGFYNEDLTSVEFSADTNAADALDLYTSFGLPSQSNYSWNQYLADGDSAEKELTTFAEGKVSMILGYSYLYEDIINEIQRLQQSGEETISINDVKIQEIPQVFDPNTSAETREVFASYFVPVVARTSDSSDEAWSFLASLVGTDSLSYYTDQTNKSASLRSLIATQQQDPIYGVFATQVGYANSISMADAEKYQELFLSAVEAILDTNSSQVVVSDLANALQSLIPSTGVKPTYVAPETE